MSTPVSLKRMEEQRSKKASQATSPPAAVTLPGTTPISAGDVAGLQKKPFRMPRLDFTDDNAGGRQYTSFEKQNQNKKNFNGGSYNNNTNGRRPYNDRARFPSKPLVPQKVKDMPMDTDFYDCKVDPEKLVCFNGRNNYLSTLYPCELEIEGTTYSSVEHYYQATKLYMLAGPEISSQIAKITDAGYAKTITKRLLRSVNISNDQVEQWKRNDALGILREAVLHKFTQNPALKAQLLKTGDSILAHTYDRDNFFATGCTEQAMEQWVKEKAGTNLRMPVHINVATVDYIPLVGQGKNILGGICMHVRQILRDHAAAEEKSDVSNEPHTVAMLQALNLN